jgi:hypothetical protein
MLEARATIARNPLLNRAALTNNPLRARADGRTPDGRRIRDLFRSYLAALGNPSDPATQAAVLAAAELIVAAEAARARLLADGSGADIDQVVRLENLAGRALKRLAIKPGAGPKPPSLAEHLANRAAERAGASSGNAA